MIFDQWCKDWQIPPVAADDLRRRFTTVIPQPTRVGKDEASVQNHLRMDEASAGVLLFRNNVGVATDSNGNFIRYGLANDSKNLNSQLKSADLIGIRKLRVMPEMVGTTIGQFVSREVKRVGWQWRGTGEEKAQAAWAKLINTYGGDALIVSGGKNG